MKKKLTYLLVLWIIISNCSSSNVIKEKGLSPISESMINQSVQKNATELLQSPSVHSVSVGVYTNGTELTEHFGMLDIGKRNIPTDDTIYEVASVTKTMTGFLVAKAILDGKMSLEDDVRIYLDGDYPNLSYENKPILIKHLLTHTSRLPGEIYGVEEFLQKGDMMGALNYANKYGKEELYRDLKIIELDAVPGTKYLYSANGPNLLGYILEDLYDKPYSQLLEESIFQKSGMHSSNLKLADKDLKRYSNGYDGQGNITPKQPGFLLGAEGQLKSTLSDLIDYMEFQLDEDNTIAIESRRQLFGGSEPLGYFWLIADRDGIPIYKHAGTAIGTTNWFIICPKYNIGVSIIISSRFQNSNHLVYEKAINLLDDIIALHKNTSE